MGNYRFRNYDTEEVINEDDAEITNYRQPDTMSPLEYADNPWKKALRCGNVYTEDSFKGVFLE